jgi:hypothetical protein
MARNRSTTEGEQESLACYLASFPVYPFENLKIITRTKEVIRLNVKIITRTKEEMNMNCVFH